MGVAVLDRKNFCISVCKHTDHDSNSYLIFLFRYCTEIKITDLNCDEITQKVCFT